MLWQAQYYGIERVFRLLPEKKTQIRPTLIERRGNTDFGFLSMIGNLSEHFL